MIAEHKLLSSSDEESEDEAGDGDKHEAREAAAEAESVEGERGDAEGVEEEKDDTIAAPSKVQIQTAKSKNPMRTNREDNKVGGRDT